MKKSIRQSVALLLCAALLFALCAAGCQPVQTAENSPVPSLDPAASAEATGEPTAEPTEEPVTEEPLPTKVPVREHGTADFSEMVYARPDFDLLKQTLDTLLADAQAGELETDAMLAEYKAAWDLFNSASSEMSLAYVYYAFDVTVDEYQDEYTVCLNNLNELDLTMTDASIALFESEKYGETMLATWGQDYADTVYLGKQLNSPEIQDFLKEEQDLTTEYDELIATFTFKYNGKSWTLNDVYADDSLSSTEWNELYLAFMTELNAQAGAIYLQLVQLRNQIATTLGYSDYAAYMYDAYGRDYTLEEAKALHAAVKETVAPAYEDLIRAYYSEMAEYRSEKCAQKDAVEKLQRVAADHSPTVAAALEFMLESGVYTTTRNSNKMEGAFTTYFSDYDSPFIFMQWENKPQSLSTLIHELGHFTNYYQNPQSGWSQGDVLDLAEIDSQGLEMLMTYSYKTFYGSYAKAARLDTLTDALYSVISGCMEDEFQQIVYQNPDMTLDEMNAVYTQLLGAYRISYLYVYCGLEWVEIPHSFQSPMYYISYATSIIPALEIWQTLQEDRDAANAAYDQLLNRPFYAKFRATVQEAGLSDPMDPATIEGITAKIMNLYG